MAVSVPEEKPNIQNAHGHFTAVVYFHGMGSQRRYEELSRLVDAVDIYLHNSKAKRAKDLGFIYDIRPRLEPFSNDPNRTLGYIRAFHRLPPNSSKSPTEPRVEDGQARFFEVYWAPIMAGQGRWRDILIWMFKQVRRPAEIIRSPWRERQRLRRAALLKLYEDKNSWPEGIMDADFSNLIKRYDKFEGQKALRKYPKGRFGDFLNYLNKKNSKDPGPPARMKSLAEKWRKQYGHSEIFNFFQMITMALALLLAIAAAIGLMFTLLRILSETNAFAGMSKWLPQLFTDKLDPSWGNAVALSALLASFLGLSRFLTRYMGDVQAWTTYEETNQKHRLRQKIIDAGVQQLRHVLEQEKCERVVIVSHSLGTTVAHDTLLALTRLNRASSQHRQDPISGPIPLFKISHFITLASPIDKVQYLFESYKSRYHRYKRVVEEIRGDIGDAPFTRNTKPYIHWINYWDEGDIISGPLHSPSSRLNFVNRVDNVLVRNFHFPAPGASHSGYFRNRTVIGDLFDVIFHNNFAFSQATAVVGQPKDYKVLYREPGEKRGLARLFFAAAASLVYFCIFYFISTTIGPPAISQFLLILILIALPILVAGFFISRALGHRNPI